MSHTPLLPLSARQLLVSPDGLHLKLGPSALANVAQHGECPCCCSAPHHHHHHHYLHFHHSATPPSSGPSGQVEQQNDLPSLAGPLSAQLIAAAAAAEEVDAATNDSAAAATAAAAAAATAAAAKSAAVVAGPEALHESELPPEILAEALPLKTLLPDGTQLGAATGEQLPKVMPKGDVGGRIRSPSKDGYAIPLPVGWQEMVDPADGCAHQP